MLANWVAPPPEGTEAGKLAPADALSSSHRADAQDEQEHHSPWPPESYRDLKPWQAFMLFTVVVALFDQITDVLIIVQWWLQGHVFWAIASLAFVLLNTAVRVIMFVWRKAWLHALLALLQMDVALEAYNQIVVLQRPPEKRSTFSAIRLFEISLEALPQLFLQSYVLFYEGFQDSSWLLEVSLAGSAFAFAWGLSALKFGEPDGDTVHKNFRGLPWRAAAFFHALSDIALRVAAVGTFSAALWSWVAVPFVLAYGPVLALHLLYGEGETASVTGAVIISIAVTLAPIAFDFPSHGHVAISLRLPYLAIIQVLMVATALTVPTPWLAAQSQSLVATTGVITLIAFVVSIMSIPGYLQALFGYTDVDEVKAAWAQVQIHRRLPRLSKLFRLPGEVATEDPYLI